MRVSLPGNSAHALLRDSYLSKVIEEELGWLESEIQQPNSKAGREFVNRRLDSLDRKFISLTLPRELIERLNTLLNERGIVRDAFFNRLFLLLSMPPEVLEEALDVPSDWLQDILESPGLTKGPLLEQVYRPLTQNFDPFFYYRQWMQDHDEDGNRISRPDQRARDGIYGHFISRSQLLERAMAARTDSAGTRPAADNTLIDLSGLNCFVPDWRVPGTKEEKESQAWATSFLEELEARKKKP